MKIVTIENTLTIKVFVEDDMVTGMSDKQIKAHVLSNLENLDYETEETGNTLKSVVQA